MTKIAIEKEKLDLLANIISEATEEQLPLTLNQIIIMAEKMKEMTMYDVIIQVDDSDWDNPYAIVIAGDMNEACQKAYDFTQGNGLPANIKIVSISIDEFNDIVGQSELCIYNDVIGKNGNNYYAHIYAGSWVIDWDGQDFSVSSGVM